MNTKAQTKKEQLLAELRETRNSILKEVTPLSVKNQGTIFLGVWSVKDLLAHLAGWDYTNLDAIKAVLAGKLPSFYEYHSRDWQTYNAILIAKYKSDSFKGLLALLENSQQELIEFLQSIVPESFGKDFGVRFRGYKVTIQRLLEAEIKDEQVHCQQIKDFFNGKVS
jgi:hypothetical protein